jgi:hypothetical protein
LSPTARTLRWLREHGIEAQVVEKVVPHSYIKIDLFGAIDIVALPRGLILGIQTTSGANHAARRTKAASNPKVIRWLQSGGHFEIWSWRKSKRKKRWMLRVSFAKLRRNRISFGEEEIE